MNDGRILIYNMIIRCFLLSVCSGTFWSKYHSLVFFFVHLHLYVWNFDSNGEIVADLIPCRATVADKLYEQRVCAYWPIPIREIHDNDFLDSTICFALRLCFTTFPKKQQEEEKQQIYVYMHLHSMWYIGMCRIAF